MILKKIKLHNIRSYPDLELDFKTGSTLLSGDIGSGKTSILLAIEFALFGLQPGQRGNALLRNGEDEGSVFLEIEVDENSFGIERNLKRGKTVSQETSYLIQGGEKTELSVTELKNKILNLLDYPLEFTKKTNLLYRFTVYTQQEEMKQIILEDAKIRLDTLRHVFGVDKYKKIIENADTIASKFREDIRKSQGYVEDIEMKKSSLKEKVSRLDQLKKESEIARHFFEEKTRERIVIESEIKDIKDKISERDNFKKEVEKSKILLATKKERISSIEGEIRRINSDINEMMKLAFSESEFKELEKKFQENKHKKDEFNKLNLEINTSIASLKIKNSDFQKTKEKMKTLEICPTCLQDVNSNYKEKVFFRIESDLNQNLQQISELEEKKRSLMLEMTKLDDSSVKLEKEISEMKMKKIRLEGVDDRKKRITELDKEITNLKKDSSILESQLETLQKSIFELSKFDLIFNQKNEILQNSLKEEKTAEIKKAEISQGIKFTEENIKEIEEEIQRKEEARKKLIYLQGVESWLTDNFIPMISFVEKSVMAKLRMEFSKLFDEWFKILVSDSFSVTLDEEFSPIIEQQGYETDYAYLSGGERTAIALAYRLALNQVINSIMSKIKTKNLIILDEPTDGFSEQQLDKMRDVLQELNAEQLILVSHEQKIESFVENIIKIRKENGVARAEIINSKPIFSAE